MNQRTDEPVTRLRLLEGWLPLATAENLAHDWGYDGPGLERLILQAAPALRRAESLLGARAVLWQAHQYLQQDTP